MASYRDWIGRAETTTQLAERWPVIGLCALLDRDPPPQDLLPPAGHWLYFGPLARQSEIGPDGHPSRDGLLPPIPQPRRMWVASDMAFAGEIRIGDPVTKAARIAAISTRRGRGGTLVRVRVENRFDIRDRTVLTETQTIVYRDCAGMTEAPPRRKPAPTHAAWSRRIDPDPVLLFRYSALTFNAHRIHYDQPYASAEEGYPGLVVQGQLTATLLLDQFSRMHPDRRIETFSCRAVKPLFCGSPFYIEGAPEEAGGFQLWARDVDGALAMTADLKPRSHAGCVAQI